MKKKRKRNKKKSNVAESAPENVSIVAQNTEKNNQEKLDKPLDNDEQTTVENKNETEQTKSSKKRNRNRNKNKNNNTAVDANESSAEPKVEQEQIDEKLNERVEPPAEVPKPESRKKNKKRNDSKKSILDELQERQEREQQEAHHQLKNEIARREKLLEKIDMVLDCKKSEAKAAQDQHESLKDLKKSLPSQSQEIPAGDGLLVDKIEQVLGVTKLEINNVQNQQAFVGRLENELAKVKETKEKYLRGETSEASTSSEPKLPDHIKKLTREIHDVKAKPRKKEDLIKEIESRDLLMHEISKVLDTTKNEIEKVQKQQKIIANLETELHKIKEAEIGEKLMELSDNIEDYEAEPPVPAPPKPTSASASLLDALMANVGKLKEAQALKKQQESLSAPSQEVKKELKAESSEPKLQAESKVGLESEPKVESEKAPKLNTKVEAKVGTTNEPVEIQSSLVKTENKAETNDGNKQPEVADAKSVQPLISKDSGKVHGNKKKDQKKNNEKLSKVNQGNEVSKVIETVNEGGKAPVEIVKEVKILEQKILEEEVPEPKSPEKKTNEIKTPEQKASEKKAHEEKDPQPKPLEQKTPVQKTLELHAPVQKTPEQMTPIQESLTSKVPRLEVSEQKAPEKAPSEQKVPAVNAQESKTPEQIIAEQKASKQVAPEKKVIEKETKPAVDVPKLEANKTDENLAAIPKVEIAEKKTAEKAFGDNKNDEANKNTSRQGKNSHKKKDVKKPELTNSDQKKFQPVESTAWQKPSMAEILKSAPDPLPEEINLTDDTDKAAEPPLISKVKGEQIEVLKNEAIKQANELSKNVEDVKATEKEDRVSSEVDDMVIVEKSDVEEKPIEVETNLKTNSKNVEGSGFASPVENKDVKPLKKNEKSAPLKPKPSAKNALTKPSASNKVSPNKDPIKPSVASKAKPSIPDPTLKKTAPKPTPPNNISETKETTPSVDSTTKQNETVSIAAHTQALSSTPLIPEKPKNAKKPDPTFAGAKINSSSPTRAPPKPGNVIPPSPASVPKSKTPSPVKPSVVSKPAPSQTQPQTATAKPKPTVPPRTSAPKTAPTAPNVKPNSQKSNPPKAKKPTASATVTLRDILFSDLKL